MLRWKKLLFISAGIVGVLLVTLLILAKTLITPERVRASIIPLVEESLQRNLRMGDIELSLFSGIVINDLVLTERNSAEQFVTVDKAVLRYRLWPLLLLRVEVDELSLERPSIRLLRFNDGRFNFSDFIESAATGAPDMSAQVSASDSSPLAIYVSEIAIIDGTLVFIDQGNTGFGQQALTALNLRAEDFSLTEPFKVALSTEWNSNDLALEGEFDLDDLSTELSVRMNTLQFTLKGDLLKQAKGERLRAELNLPTTSISTLISSIPKDVGTLPALPGLSGQLGAQLVMDGMLTEPDSLISSGRIDLDQITVATGAIRSTLHGTAFIERKTIKADGLSLTINDQPLDVAIVIDDFMSQPLKADFTISSAKFDLDRLIPAADDTVLGETVSESVVQSVEAGPLDLPVELNGTVRVEQLLYRGLALQNVLGRLILKNNRLTIERLAAAVAGGRIEQSGQIDLGVRGFRYDSSTSLQKVKINPVVTALKPELAKSIFGVVDGQIVLSGAGTLPATAKKNLDGKADFVLRQAKLTNLPALDSAAGLLGTAELKEVVIDDGQAAFKIKDGLVVVDLKSAGPLIKQTTSGTVTLAGKLGLKVKLSLAPQLGRKLDNKGLLRNVLVGRDGWSHVPLRVKGDYSTPLVTLDMQKIRKQATQGALDSLADRLLKKAGGGNNGTETQPKEDPAAKLIDDALKRLFGN